METAKRAGAVIFDLDGTLTRPILDFDAIRAEIGIESGPVLEAMDAMPDEQRERASAILDQREWEAACRADLQEGAARVVKACRDAGFSVAILTRNTRRVLQHVLERFAIVVDAVRTREDGPVKPSAEPVRSLCTILQADPAQSWMVGDYLFDMVAGREAGTKTVLMIGDNAPPPFADQADYVIRRLSELLPIIGVC